MAGLSEALQIFLAKRAVAMNEGTVPGEEAVGAISREGRLRLGVPSHWGGSGGSLADAVEAIASVSEYCLTSGFLFWCQRVFIEYLVQSDNRWLQEHLLSQVLAGELHGATGLSNAVKHLAGIEPLRLNAGFHGDTVTVNGGLPWVSNLASGRFVVAVGAQIGEKQWAIVAVPSSAGGVAPGKELSLLGLGSSLTAPIRFDEVSLPSTWVIHRQGDVFLRRVRSRFLLLQIGMSLGLARRALREAYMAASITDHVLKPRLQNSAETLRRLETVLYQFGLNDGIDSGSIPRLFEVKIAFANLAMETVWLELQAKGGRGYLKSCETGRRLREAAFLPVVSPTCVQLEVELEQFQKEVEA